MVGYKALNQDMSSRYGNMVYEMGKWYKIKGENIIIIEKLNTIPSAFILGIDTNK